MRRVGSDGNIETVAGGGTQCLVRRPRIVNGLALDAAGNLYFCETNRIRKLTPSGALTTYAGTGTNGFSGDGGPASAAVLSQPLGLAFDAQGNLYVADGDVVNFPSRIREIALNGTISTVAGGGSKTPADGAAALSLNLAYASGLAVDAANNLYVFAPKNGYLLKISAGVATLVTSPPAAAFATNVPARNAYVVGQRVYDNSGIALDAAGNLYVADSRDGRLCKIDTHGMLTTLAGNGAYGFGGDGGPALGAIIQGPAGITQTPDGTLYFLDTLNTRVRAISPGGSYQHCVQQRKFSGAGDFRISERDYLRRQRQRVRATGASGGRIDATGRDRDHRQSTGRPKFEWRWRTGDTGVAPKRRRPGARCSGQSYIFPIQPRTASAR